MEILTTIAQVRALLNATRAQGKTIGVMGTSGRLHGGHLSLMRRAVAENDFAMMFWVGDMRFSWAPGLTAPGYYDRNWNVDRPLVESTGIRHAYLPDGDDHMPEPSLTVTVVPKLSTECPPMEAVSHLNAVTFATAKLYNIFGAVRYYSGEKDWQQLAIFKRIAIDLSAEAEVIGCPVMREEDGLALSSRNVNLTPEEREKAPALYAALQAGAAAIDAGERSSSVIEKLIRDRLNAVGEAIYVNAVDAHSLQPMEKLQGEIRLIASLKLGIVPLVDNIGATAV